MDDPQVLRGWKEIAAYFSYRDHRSGKVRSLTPRTVKRYHELYGLPVIRSVSRHVWTTREAITAWVAKLSHEEREVFRMVKKAEREAGVQQPTGPMRVRYNRYVREELGGEAGQKARDALRARG